MKYALVAAAQAKLDEARRALRLAANDFNVTDETVLELRAAARHAYTELKELDRNASKPGILSLFKIW